MIHAINKTDMTSIKKTAMMQIVNHKCNKTNIPNFTPLLIMEVYVEPPNCNSDCAATDDKLKQQGQSRRDNPLWVRPGICIEFLGKRPGNIVLSI